MIGSTISADADLWLTTGGTTRTITYMEKRKRSVPYARMMLGYVRLRSNMVIGKFARDITIQTELFFL